MPGIWIGTAALLAYSVGGGIFAGIYTDVFQGLLMAVASTVVFVFALESGNGLAAITRAIEPVVPAAHDHRDGPRTTALRWRGHGRRSGLATGPALTLGLESAAWRKLISLPTGVTVSGLTLVTSLLVFIAVSLATRGSAAEQLDTDIRAVMET